MSGLTQGYSLPGGNRGLRSICSGGRRVFRLMGCIGLFSFLMGGQLLAESKPLLELGIGAGVLSIPDYRGADERQLLGLPIPYVIYRGEKLRVDRSGVTGELLADSRWELDISASGAPPANTDDNSVRSGMPDLAPAIELGPELVYKLGHPFANSDLTLNFPVRTVIEIDGTDLSQVGWLAEPNIDLDARRHVYGWDLGMRAGLFFADAEYHNYYYGVPARFATAARPAYQASGGYSGAFLITRLSRRFKHFWVGTFLRYDNLDGVEQDDSPLLEKRHSAMFGLGFAWVFHQSEKRVELDEY